MPARAEEAQRQDDRAYELMQSANSLIEQGQWAEAARSLEQAAEIHRQAGRAYDEGRCLQMAATLLRSAGHPDQARELLARAAAVDVDDRPLVVSILTEQGETAFAEGRFEDAVTAYTSALREARKAGLKAERQSALLRRRAAASIALGSLAAADADFKEAFQQLDAVSGREVAAFVRTEQADLLWQAGALDEMARVLETLEAELQGRQVQPHLAAELQVMRARLARAANQPQIAVEYAEGARQAALEAVAPVSYFAASVELAEALHEQGDRTGAYGALASAWATLSDLLGDDLADSWMEPVMLEYVARWGETAFRQAKAAYEAARHNQAQTSS